MAVGIFKIDASTSIVMINFIRLRSFGIGPVGQVSRVNASENRVEVILANQKCVVLWRDLARSLSMKSRDTLLSSPTTMK